MKVVEFKLTFNDLDAITIESAARACNESFDQFVARQTQDLFKRASETLRRELVHNLASIKGP